MSRVPLTEPQTQKPHTTLDQYTQIVKKSLSRADNNQTPLLRCQKLGKRHGYKEVSLAVDSLYLNSDRLIMELPEYKYHRTEVSIREPYKRHSLAAVAACTLH